MARCEGESAGLLTEAFNFLKIAMAIEEGALDRPGDGPNSPPSVACVRRSAMPLPIRLRDVVEELQVASEEISAYINRKTGKLISITHEEARMVEDEDAPSRFTVIDHGAIRGWTRGSCPA